MVRECGKFIEVRYLPGFPVKLWVRNAFPSAFVIDQDDFLVENGCNGMPWYDCSWEYQRRHSGRTSAERLVNVVRAQVKRGTDVVIVASRLFPVHVPEPRDVEIEIGLREEWLERCCGPWPSDVNLQRRDYFDIVGTSMNVSKIRIPERTCL